MKRRFVFSKRAAIMLILILGLSIFSNSKGWSLPWNSWDNFWTDAGDNWSAFIGIFSGGSSGTSAGGSGSTSGSGSGGSSIPGNSVIGAVTGNSNGMDIYGASAAAGGNGGGLSAAEERDFERGTDAFIRSQEEANKNKDGQGCR